MANRDRIPAHMLEEIEENQLATWDEIDGCKNFPNCLSEDCNTGCDKEHTFGDGWQWGEL